jgi:hypothetical protein
LSGDFREGHGKHQHLRGMARGLRLIPRETESAHDHEVPTTCRRPSSSGGCIRISVRGRTARLWGSGGELLGGCMPQHNQSAKLTGGCMKAPSNVPLHRAKWPSRCSVCAGDITKGQLIGLPPAQSLQSPPEGRATWAHARCSEVQMDEHSALLKRTARIHYRIRVQRKDKSRRSMSPQVVPGGAQ